MLASMVRIEVRGDGVGSLLVTWEPRGPGGSVSIGVGPSADPSGHVPVVELASAVGRARLDGLGPGRHYVSLSEGGRTIVAAERLVAFERIYNFRDIGGYPTDSGRFTRWGLVYRSGSLHGPTPADLVAFDTLGISTIYDLRRDDERAEAPGRRAAVHLMVPDGDGVQREATSLRSRRDGEQWLFDYYLRILGSAGPVFGELLTDLAAADAGPVVIHCMGGKDRTGMAVALLLGWLGVDRETVLDDYELTTVHADAENVASVIESFSKSGIARAAALGMLSTPRWAMARVLGILDEVYGGVEPYLLGSAAMTPSALGHLRTRLLS